MTGAESGTVPVERDLAWPGVAWVAWRQHRAALRGCGALFGAAALLLLVNGLAMRGLYHRRLGLSGCAVQNLTPARSATVKQFQQNFGIWTGLIPGTPLLVVPVTAGTFTGAAVVAREIERGTFRFAWTQGCGLLRPPTGKIAVLAAAAAAGRRRGRRAGARGGSPRSTRWGTRGCTRSTSRSRARPSPPGRCWPSRSRWWPDR